MCSYELNIIYKKRYFTIICHLTLCLICFVIHGKFITCIFYTVLFYTEYWNCTCMILNIISITTNFDVGLRKSSLK